MSPRPSKRAKIDDSQVESRPPTPGEDDSWRVPVDYSNGVVLAPMVRSGSLPTRLLSLKYGASLVWSPEIVDKAIIGCQRIVDERTGVISYVKPNSTSAVFTTHPVERTHLIFQIGSSNPDLAVQAAKTVLQDVAGIDLNCGCPKPFSVHAGMGAALLTTPDLLCGILSKLRASLPLNVPVSAKIRLLPDAEATRALVSRIWREGGVSALTVHCRTREMRPATPAVTTRMREAVDQVAEIEAEDESGRRIAVIYNGDCSGAAAAQEIRDSTGATSVMLARAAESNPSCFDTSRPVRDAELEMIPEYLRLAKYLGNQFGNTRYCIQQFSSPSTPESRQALSKDARKAFRQQISQARSYEMLGQVIPGGGGLDGGEAIIREIQDIMELRVGNAKQVELKSTTPLPNISPEPILDQPTAVTVA
ncbi:TRNA-dihydrouridine synthase [Ceratobasidium theobromae]|uniref:tRNA-dihydrouridine synthase n=1 Tax=Ceratobasidium theobromae TaxID=1582974 RepID=A0A5N5QJY0_9AGAM|nr:TRNA-dihydrouridine synthase [Ceratobasidium theobromae]